MRTRSREEAMAMISGLLRSLNVVDDEQHRQAIAYWLFANDVCLVDRKVLVDLVGLLPPPPVTAADGKSYFFQDPHAATRLHQIRKLFDDLAI